MKIPLLPVLIIALSIGAPAFAADDAPKGAVKSPLLLWGPYLWADGTTARKADGLTCTRADLSDKDGTHPAESARTKVAELLLKFLKGDPTAKTWFTGNPSPR